MRGTWTGHKGSVDIGMWTLGAGSRGRGGHQGWVDRGFRHDAMRLERIGGYRVARLLQIGRKQSLNQKEQTLRNLRVSGSKYFKLQ